MPDTDKLTATLQHIYRILGPTAPSCCEGCQVEIAEALKAVKESGVDLSEIGARIERRRRRIEAEVSASTISFDVLV